MTDTRRRVTGHYAGPVTRLLATALDGAIISLSFTAGVAVLSFGLRLVAGIDLAVDVATGWVWLVALTSWSFLYAYTGLSVAGRTPGKAVVGLRVVHRAGTPLRSRQALVRVLTLPLSFALFGAGFAGILVGRERRALHDLLAGSAVVYDWGDRAAELPTPLSRFLTRRDEVVDVGLPGGVSARDR